MASKPVSPKYKRILLKVSGEGLAGPSGSIDPDACQRLIDEVKPLIDVGVEVAIVCGGGNLFRGINAGKFRLERNRADHIGMLATIMNGIALREFFRDTGIPCAALSALPVPGVIAGFDIGYALDQLKKHSVLICVGGTGHPYFSTDTAAALRAIQLHADVLIKSTKVEGVFDCDPVTNSAAIFFDELTYDDVLEKNLKVMDQASIAICRDQSLNIIVTNMKQRENLYRIVMGEKIGSLITKGGQKD